MVKNNVFNLSPSIANSATFRACLNTNQQSFVGDMGIVNATSNNYNDLNNKPSINNVVLVGAQTSQTLNIIEDKNFVFSQNISSDSWYISHNLNKFPSVSVVDSGNNIVIGEVIYIDENNLQILFTAPFSGKAYLN